MFLSEAETAEIDASIARLEARADVQVVTAVVDKADAYPELLWMAFALGVSLPALAAVVVDWLHPRAAPGTRRRPRISRAKAPLALAVSLSRAGAARRVSRRVAPSRVAAAVRVAGSYALAASAK
jgi:hypothetical protein